MKPMRLTTHDEILELATHIERRKYTSEAALNDITAFMNEKIGLTNFKPDSSRFNSDELQMLFNVLDLLGKKAEELDDLIESL